MINKQLYDYSVILNDNDANVVPIRGRTKKPLGKWKAWQAKKQPAGYLDEIDWSRVSGLAVINGPGDWRSIDIDDCDDEQFVYRLLDTLDLSRDYPWVVKSPNGFHVWIRSSDDPEDVSIETIKVHTDACKQIEIRWSGGYTIMPGSWHPSGVRYRFLGSVPSNPPLRRRYVDVEQAVQSIAKPKYQFDGTIDPVFAEGKSSGPWGGDVQSVESALKHLADEVLSPPEYNLWLRIASAVIDGLGEEKGLQLMKTHFPPVDSDGRDYERKEGRWLEDVNVGTLFYEAKQAGWEPTWNAGGDQAEPSVEGGFPAPKRARDVQTEPISWMWPGYLMKGGLHVLDGAPGVNKTTMLLDVAACFSRGKTPEGHDISPHNTLYVSGEDTAGHVLVPRYRAAGGDEDRLFTYDTRNVGQISFPDSADNFAAVIRKREVTFCVIDPFFAMLDRGYSMNDEQAVRKVLSGLQRIAETTGCAFVLVRHPNKKEGLSSINRGGGSIGIIAQARLAFMVGRHPRHTDRRVFALVKNNLSSKSRYESLVFDVTSGTVQTENGEASTPVIDWKGTEAITADDVYNKPHGRPPTKRRKAQSFLEKALSNGPVPKNDLLEQMEDKDFSPSTLDNASNDMDIVKQQGTHNGERCFWWSLPSKTDGDV